ncbi:hypothetical protein ILUMI_02652 [Ignelater luminosus]|uniref:NADP-dependent oxidoreductase domain-containing protein n=1 Tax=Ignelater luminosus TaxID=2038154 RepID=A0A8K0DD20_IGNLU|nr:hypothetical protein ILUMI_02652 [Ignelater luminosus]
MVNTRRIYELSSGHKMPMIGLGTYLLTDKRSIWKIIDEALSAGYRLIDTAAMYGNEEEIGYALKKLLPKHHLTRQDIFLISKLPPTNHGDDALESLNETIRLLQCEYLDLYLIHWPGSSDCDPKDPNNAILRDKSWSKLVEAKQTGLTRDIGVSNYSIRHLEGLLENSYGEKPVVNQIEWHPHCHQDNMKKFCDENGILIQSYFSFGGSEKKLLLSDPTVLNISEKIGKSAPQILLQWSLQQNVAVIPKSSSRQHLHVNIDLDFVIPKNYMEKLSNLPQIRYGSDPNVVA